MRKSNSRIAIIGSGISGLTTAYLLSKNHDIRVFEAGSHIGGHTNTLDVRVPSGRYAVDTGFIVFNDWTYPNFIELMNQSGVQWQDTAMSFSVKVESNGLEYNGTNLNSLFAQRRNFFNPRFYRMISDIIRFNKESLATLETESTMTLGEYLSRNGYSREFKDHYIVPMGAAIWSCSVEQMDQFPVSYFVRFFKNHGMLSVDDRPVWKVIKGGSRAYVEPVCRRFRDRIQLNSPVRSILRKTQNGVTIVEVQVEHEGRIETHEFDEVVLACHSDQALKMLNDATELEREILSGFQYQPNATVLHTDENVLPKRKLAWAAWNYFVPKEQKKEVAVSYDMNILQGIQSPETFVVSLNMDDRIREDRVLARLTYHHPVYTRSAFESQKRWAEISGQNGVHFCGAYWGYGFHEDGVKSALKVCEQFGETLGGARV
jgi:predicted NAD/FAD-binding protein